MKKYELHSPKHDFFGKENPQSLEDVLDHARSLGLNMTRHFIPDGLNTFEEQNPKKAVIFNVENEDVVMVEGPNPTTAGS
jgi:hypothetical protein